MECLPPPHVFLLPAQARVRSQPLLDLGLWLLFSAVGLLLAQVRMEPAAGDEHGDGAGGLGTVRHPGECSGCVISSPFPLPVTAAPGAFVFKDKDFSVSPKV